MCNGYFKKWYVVMKELNCSNCFKLNLVNSVTENFTCGECGQENEGINFEELYEAELKRAYMLVEMHDKLADRLRERDNEVWRLCRLLDENNIKYEVE